MILKRDLVVPDQISEEDVPKIIEQQINENELLIYMKGSSMLPQCGFSARTIEIFNRIGVPYRTFDVLSNFEIREGIKKHSNWPTIPQVYFKQKFIGGCDIVTEMHESGELEKLLKGE